VISDYLLILIFTYSPNRKMQIFSTLWITVRQPALQRTPHLDEGCGDVS